MGSRGRLDHTVKNSSIHNGKPKLQCKDCSCQFVVNPTNHSIVPGRKQLIDKLLLERISLRGITRVTGISLSRLQTFPRFFPLSQVRRRYRPADTEALMGIG